MMIEVHTINTYLIYPKNNFRSHNSMHFCSLGLSAICLELSRVGSKHPIKVKLRRKNQILK